MTKIVTITGGQPHMIARMLDTKLPGKKQAILDFNDIIDSFFMKGTQVTKRDRNSLVTSIMETRKFLINDILAIYLDTIFNDRDIVYLLNVDRADVLKSITKKYNTLNVRVKEQPFDLIGSSIIVNDWTSTIPDEEWFFTLNLLVNQDISESISTLANKIREEVE